MSTHFPLRNERHPDLLNRSTSVLVVVDMQEPFLGVIHGRESLTANVLLLCRAAQILHIPIIATEQYAERMGLMIPEIADVLGKEKTAINKLGFSCMDSPEFRTVLAELGRHQVVVCGVETHICVSQTAHDLLHANYSVHVPAGHGANPRCQHQTLCRRSRRLRMAPGGRNAGVQRNPEAGEVRGGNS